MCGVSNDSMPAVSVRGGGIAANAAIEAVLRAVGIELVRTEDAVVDIVIVADPDTEPLDPEFARPAVIVTTEARYSAWLAELVPLQTVSIVDLASADEILVPAVLVAARRGVVMPSWFARNFLSERVGTITSEETRWLHALEAGCTVLDLARLAGYSERSMYRRLASLYGRLGAANRREALAELRRREEPGEH